MAFRLYSNYLNTTATERCIFFNMYYNIQAVLWRMDSFDEYLHLLDKIDPEKIELKLKNPKLY